MSHQLDVKPKRPDCYQAMSDYFELLVLQRSCYEATLGSKQNLNERRMDPRVEELLRDTDIRPSKLITLHLSLYCARSSFASLTLAMLEAKSSRPT